MRRVIYHVPHDGFERPPELMDSVCVSQNAFLYYEKMMRDTDVRLMVPSGGESVCFKVSRLLCDVERFTDGTEIMDKYGMGFCYEKVYDGTVIKTLSPDLLNATMKYYSAHHARLDSLTAASSGGLFIIDLHSFSNEIVINPNVSRFSPDICIGYDNEYCPEDIVGAVADLCAGYGYEVALNTPYAGSFIPNVAIKNKLHGCCSIMLEINKTVYMANGVSNRNAIKRLRKLLSEIEILLR